ncbi:MAG: hypothetical protein KFF68_06825, partial [Desulfosarcina sp.]|nr:hypothetical protein [Desulfosarcina sp.]
MVETFVDIQPERVRLIGPANQPLFAEVEIVPKKAFPFAIEQITANSGQFIRYEMTQRCSEEASRCVLRVENTRKTQG